MDELVRTDDTHITELRPLISPAILLEEIPISGKLATAIAAHRREIAELVHGKGDGLLVVVGPCSIHDTKAALEYGERLAKAQEDWRGKLKIVMRVYFEKPRTTTGWKGLINDPDLNDTYRINHGLRVARALLRDLGDMGLAVGTEFLDTISPQFIADLVSWGAIGARTTESQVHRELASGLSMPIGFKNSTLGDIQIAADAIVAARHPHRFLGATKQGITAIVGTTGNPNCHVILRGGKAGPNYEPEHVQQASEVLHHAGVDTLIMVDCSHGNSNKDPKRQPEVARSVGQQRNNGAKICGLMLESHLRAGKQKLNDPASLEYGVSITDGCLDWESTVEVLDQLAGN